MSICHHLCGPGKLKYLILEGNYESDWDLLLKNKHFNFPGLQMMANIQTAA